MKVAKVIYQQLEIGAVAITDREKLLAFIGIGSDHHLPGTPISSEQSRRAIENNEVFMPMAMKYLTVVQLIQPAN